MKRLQEIYSLVEHDIVPEKRKKKKVLKTRPKMKKTYPPFSKGAFAKLIDVTGGPQIKDPAGGKVIKKSNTMKKTS